LSIRATKTFRKHGKELALSADDSKAIPFNSACVVQSVARDELPRGLFEAYADVLVNMGTYLGR
jgi:hypothetical protein